MIIVDERKLSGMKIEEVKHEIDVLQYVKTRDGLNNKQEKRLDRLKQFMAWNEPGSDSDSDSEMEPVVGYTSSRLSLEAKAYYPPGWSEPESDPEYIPESEPESESESEFEPESEPESGSVMR